MTTKNSELAQISPEHIVKNPDNPRLIFREEEMNQLLESIKEVGIKVPLSVYKDGNKFVIIDGERRWRCSLKLNLKSVPAIVQPKPDKLENLLMMFNIHNVRVQWDLMPTAFKLDEVKKLLEKEGKNVTKGLLASITGMTTSTVGRCLDLLDLPKKYQDMLMKDAEKPKSQQELSPDLFIEIVKSRKSIERHAPEVFKEIEKSKYVDIMLEKYKSGIINNLVKFRDISKITRGETKGVAKHKVVSTLVKLAKEKNYKIENAFTESAESNYKIEEIKRKTESLIFSLENYKGKLPEENISLLEKLKGLIERAIK